MRKNCRESIEFSSEVYKELETDSIRDQISTPYVVWKRREAGDEGILTITESFTAHKGQLPFEKGRIKSIDIYDDFIVDDASRELNINDFQLGDIGGPGMDLSMLGQNIGDAAKAGLLAGEVSKAAAGAAARLPGRARLDEKDDEEAAPAAP